MLVKFNILPTRCSSLLILIQETLGTGSPDTSQLSLYGRPSIAASEDLTTSSTDEESAIKLIKLFYHINCGIIQGFLALRKAITTHVKKNSIFSRMLI